MPYKRIYWTKLEKRLLNDYRFYTMSEAAQLIFLKFFMLAAETNNKIPKNSLLIKSALRSSLQPTEIEKCILEIKNNFPKFKENKKFYYFLEWSKRHHWVEPTELLRNTEGTPTELPEENRIDIDIDIDKNRIDKIRIEYIRLKGLDIKNFFPDDFARTAKAIKTLIFKAGGQETLVLEGLRWLSKQRYEWTLETLVKQWANFMKEKERYIPKEEKLPLSTPEEQAKIRELIHETAQKLKAK